MPEIQAHNPNIARNITVIATATLLSAAALAGCSSSAEQVAPQPQSEWLLDTNEMRAACDASELDISFRGDKERQNYASIQTGSFSGKPVSNVINQFYPGTPKDIALKSIQQANPGMTFKSAESTVPKGAKVTVNISSFDFDILPTGQTIAEYGQERGFDAGAMACVNAMKPEARFDGPVSINVPRQIESPAGGALTMDVVRKGDNYTVIAKRNGVVADEITPEAALAQNIVPPTKLQPGDIVYIVKESQSADTGNKTPDNTSDNTPAPKSSPEIVEPNAETKQFVEEYKKYALEVEKEFGIPHQAVLAQAILETGYGKSELATKANNFFGLKANDEWHGKVYTKNTREVIDQDQLDQFKDKIIDQKPIGDGKIEIIIEADFQQFDSVEEGFRGYGQYIKNRNDGKAYADALGTSDPIEYIKRLVDDKGSKYATDPKYAERVTTIIQKVQATETPTAQEETTQNATDFHSLYYGQYKDRRDHFTIRGENCKIGPNGEDESTFSDYERSEIAYNNIEAAHPTKEAYEAFKGSIINQIADAQKVNRNFDGRNFDKLGKPTDIRKQVEYFVFHYTANPGEKSDSYDGVGLASSMWQNYQKTKDPGGINYFINFDGTNAHTYQTSDTFTFHVPALKGNAFGVEIGAGCQAKVRPQQVEQGVYLAVYFLTENGYLEGDVSSSKVVEDVIRGHGEFQGWHPGVNDHTDWPKMHMDQLRTKIKMLLVDLGYKL